MFIGSQDVCGYDYFYLRVNDQNIGYIELCKNNNTDEWIEFVVDMRTYVGSNKKVSFVVVTDESANSNLFLDDVSMSSYSSKSASPGEASFDFSRASESRK